MLPKHSMVHGTCRERARAAMLGAFVADAATMSLHWIYDPSEIKAILKGSDHPEFFDPPHSPFYKYPLGSLSPYGDEALALLTSATTRGHIGVRTRVCTGHSSVHTPPRPAHLVLFIMCPEQVQQRPLGVREVLARTPLLASFRSRIRSRESLSVLVDLATNWNLCCQQKHRCRSQIWYHRRQLARTAARRVCA